MKEISCSVNEPALMSISSSFIYLFIYLFIQRLLWLKEPLHHLAAGTHPTAAATSAALSLFSHLMLQFVAA